MHAYQQLNHKLQEMLNTAQFLPGTSKHPFLNTIFINSTPFMPYLLLVGMQRHILGEYTLWKNLQQYSNSCISYLKNKKLRGVLVLIEETSLVYGD